MKSSSGFALVLFERKKGTSSSVLVEKARGLKIESFRISRITLH